MTQTFERQQTGREELANTISHAFGAVLVLVAGPLLVMSSYEHGGPVAAASTFVYSGSVALLYVASTTYHALRPSRAKRVFRALDHSAIFVLIAGTYTPFGVGVLRGPWGTGLLVAVWTLAVVGIAVDAARWRHSRKVTIGLYLVMGWLAVVALGPIVERVAPTGITLLLAGGLAYTVGTVFYALKRLQYAHLVWHMFVLAGSALHFVAVVRYAA